MGAEVKPLISRYHPAVIAWVYAIFGSIFSNRVFWELKSRRRYSLSKRPLNLKSRYYY
jgi:hypothetical protein